MSLSMYVAGECEILIPNISRKEFKGIMRLLKKMAYFSSMFEWKPVLQFYAAWVHRIEKGLNLWHDDSSLIEKHNVVQEIVQQKAKQRCLAEVRTGMVVRIL